MKLCDYGCGREAKYPFKNGKWCCEDHYSKCPVLRRNNSREKKTNPIKYWLGKKRPKESIKKQAKSLRGNIPWNKSKIDPYTEKTKQKMSLNSKYTFKQLQEKHPFFCQIEDVREGPEIGLFFVHCHNHNCSNSKEKYGHFIVNYNCICERIRQLENKDGNDGAYLYCSEKCKQNCPSFNLKSDPCEHTKKSYTNEEYQTFRKFVLERDNYICQFCGDTSTDVHHERPQKLEPFFALDPDLAWSCCEKCHYKYGHKKRTPCSTGNLASEIC